MTDFMHFLVFLANRAKILYGNPGDYHLSIGIEKSRFWALFVIFDFLGPHKGRCPTGASKPTKKLTHLVEILGHLLSRNHVSNFFDLGTDAANHLTHLYFFL